MYLGWRVDRKVMMAMAGIGIGAIAARMPMKILLTIPTYLYISINDQSNHDGCSIDFLTNLAYMIFHAMICN